LRWPGDGGGLGPARTGAHAGPRAPSLDGGDVMEPTVAALRRALEQAGAQS
jgi:hypothetical protein